MAVAPHQFTLSERLPIEAIPKALRTQREAIARANNDPNALRVCTLNLAAMCNDEGRCDDTLRVLASMVAEHPGRLFLVHAHREWKEEELAARVAVDSSQPAGGAPPTYSELIDLTASGRAVEYLPATLASLLEADQPACSWWASPPQFTEMWDRASHMAERMVVDTAELDPWDLMRLVEYVKSDTAGSGLDDHAALGDLNWARVKPHMALVARFYDSAELRELFNRVDRITVRHTPPSGAFTAIGPAMLGAWVQARLLKAARASRLKLEPQVKMEKVAAHDDLAPGETAELILSSSSGPGEIRITRPQKGMLAAEAKGTTSMPAQRVRVHTHDKSWLLAEELQTYGRDPLFEQAFLSAVDILRESRR